VAKFTSSQSLPEQGIKMWDGNGGRKFLDSVGLSHREEGDLGSVYGFQWRHFGAEYKDANTDYTGQGIDQIADVIDKLKNKPYDRHYPKYIEPRQFEEDSSSAMPHVRSILRLISTSIVYKNAKW
jgi:thymidylate synthase